MQTKRLLISGIAGGVVMWVVDSIANGVVLRDRFQAIAEAGGLQSTPRLPFYPLWALLMLGLGIGVAWIYACARTRLGPGPKTALTVGVLIGLMIYLPSNLTQASWGMLGRSLPLVWFVFGVVGTIAGALVAGALYKEEAAK